MVDLSGYTDIETCLLVRLEIENYRESIGDVAEPVVANFSDYYRGLVLDGEDYDPVGKLLAVTASRSELKVSRDSITVTISGVPNEDLQEILASDIKGSKISIWRALINSTTGAILSVTGNPTGRFFGYVNNYSIEENYEILELEGTHTIQLECSSFISLYGTYVAGRRTNPVDEKLFFPNDVSFDRVPTLVGSNYNFGAPK
jgi:hypothetical protein